MTNGVAPVQTMKASGIGGVAPRILNFNSTWRSASCPGCFTDSVGAWLEPPASLNPFGAELNLMSLLEIETRLVRYSMARKSEIRKVLIPSLQLGRSVHHLSVFCVSRTRHINILCVCMCVCVCGVCVCGVCVCVYVCVCGVCVVCVCGVCGMCVCVLCLVYV